MYHATIQHHSIARAHSITIDGTLDDAQLTASVEFGDGFPDHTIVITDEIGNIVSSRRIGDDDWTTCGD